MTTKKPSAPTSVYRGGRSEKDIQAMINDATPDRMKAAQPEIDRMAASAKKEREYLDSFKSVSETTPKVENPKKLSIADQASVDNMNWESLPGEGKKKGGVVKKAPVKVYKSGGVVKSGASRGDGCAIKGRTKGRVV